jgi:serine protease inhibitor
MFKADRPFIFVIKDDRTGAIWVIGRVVRPTVV